MQENNENRKEFICTKCGACCRNIGYVEEAAFLDRGDGVCKYLDEKTNLCIIHDFRPDICRMDKMYKRYKNKMTWDEYVELNYKSCKYLQELEKAKEFRKMYPNKKRYNDIIEGNQDDTEILSVEKPKEEYLDLSDSNTSN